MAAAWFSGCKSKQICPAYQSAFYLDKKIADEEFSYFDKDSLPKMEETIRKSDVLLVIRLGKKRINKRMAVVPMITIFPEQADSALAMADSLSADSLGTEEGLEQEQGEETESDTLGGEKEQNLDEDLPKEELEAPKAAKKVDLKDPELSDPTLKAEFEESFDEAPKEEDFEEPPAIEPEVPKKKSKKKSKDKPAKEPKKKAVPEKPKEEEPEPAPADDKF